MLSLKSAKACGSIQKSVEKILEKSAAKMQNLGNENFKNLKKCHHMCLPMIWKLSTYFGFGLLKVIASQPFELNFKELSNVSARAL